VASLTNYHILALTINFENLCSNAFPLGEVDDRRCLDSVSTTSLNVK